MTSYELISTISLCFTALIAVSAFFVPLLINERSNRRKEKREEREKLYNELKEEVEITLEEEFKIISEFDEAFTSWQTSATDSYFIKMIYNTMSNFQAGSLRSDLETLIKKVKDKEDRKKIIDWYEYCRKNILIFFDIDIYSQELIKIELRKSLREKLKIIKH